VATTEATLRASILKAIRLRYHRRDGVLVFGRPASAATGPGHPDLFGVVQGFFLALEIKTRTGRPTPLQVQRLLDLRECGAYAWVVRSPAEALAALAWILEGGRAPMTDEPIDLSSWLNTAPMTPVEQGAAEAVASVTAADVATAQTAFDAEAREVGDDFLATFPAALTAPVENGAVEYTPEPLPDFPSVDQPAPAVSLGDDPADEPPDTRAFHSMLHNDLTGARAEIRAVGDRVTLVFESLNRLETDVAAFRIMFRALLKALEVDESELPEVPPAEPKRTRRKKTEASAAE
jgi:hypothetical protein